VYKVSSCIRVAGREGMGWRQKLGIGCVPPCGWISLWLEPRTLRSRPCDFVAQSGCGLVDRPLHVPPGRPQVETIGDCYFVAGGLIREDEDGMAAVREGGSTVDPLHVEKVFMFAKVRQGT
jgi:hypothetical protein